MINHPVFFANDPKRYFWLEWVQKTIPTWMKKFPLVPTPSVENPLLLAEYSERLVTLLAVAVPLGIKGAKLFWEVTGSKIVSPLTASYWSMSAYRLGNPPHKMAVRFSVTPRQNQPPKFIADTSSRNYLRETMKSQLAKDEWQFDFKLQRNPAKASVEDTMVEWQAEQAKEEPVTVATITIPKQEFDTPARHQFCEGLSFNPWHALQEHRPLGGVNRMRRAVYEKVSKMRRELNGFSVANRLSRMFRKRACQSPSDVQEATG